MNTALSVCVITLILVLFLGWLAFVEIWYRPTRRYDAADPRHYGL